MKELLKTRLEERSATDSQLPSDAAQHDAPPTVARREVDEPDQASVSEAVVDAFEALPEDFKSQWRVVAQMDPLHLARRVVRDFEDSPTERREILTAYIARKLGYRWYFNRAASLRVRPLWDLLHRDTFAMLDAHDRHLVWIIACSTRRNRSTLHPNAALAAIALWRHGDAREQARAEMLLCTRGLPTDVRWLYELVRELGRRNRELEVPEKRSLLALAHTQLASGLWDVVALMAGLFFVRRFDPWYVGSPHENLIAACDRVADERPWEYASWLQLMADAAVQGELTYTWLERPLAACIRMSVGDAERNRQLRDFHRRRLYEASSARLKQLYRYEFEGLSQVSDVRESSLTAGLLQEVEFTAVDNPVRAMHLLELLITPLYGARRAVVLQQATQLDSYLERLLTLYVRCYNLDQTAVGFVRRHHTQVHWDAFPDVEADDVQMYLGVSDYELAFEPLDARFDGVSVEHVDKDAAARVRYFQQSRSKPNSLTELVSNFRGPAQWMLTTIGESETVDLAMIRLVEAFERRVARFDLTAEVLEDLRAVGARVETWEDVQKLPITRIEKALRHKRHQRLLAGALLGGAAGALAPSTSGMTSIADVPLIVLLVADTCARYCWYYGFDPRENPELPLKILAVALSGARPERFDGWQARHDLQEYLVRRSLLIGAVAQGAIGQLTSSTLTSLVDGGRFRGLSLLSNLLGPRAGLRQRSIERLSRWVLPTLDGLLGASLNVSLVYDLCESAQAVLTDRFLARKYSDWKSRY